MALVVVVGDRYVLPDGPERIDKDIVDPCAIGAELKSVKSAFRTVRGEFAEKAGVGQQAPLDQLVWDGTGHTIEISHQQDGLGGEQGVQLPQDQERAFLAGFWAPMVEMGIEKIHLFSRRYLLKTDPGDHAGKGGIPAHLARGVWLFGQPVGSGFEHLPAVFPVEKRRELPSFQAVVPASPNPGPLRQTGGNVLDLVVQRLLQSENLRVVVANEVGNPVLPVFPAVDPVVWIVEPDIEGHDPKGGRGLRAEHGQWGKSEEQKKADRSHTKRFYFEMKKGQPAKRPTLPFHRYNMG